VWGKRVRVRVNCKIAYFPLSVEPLSLPPSRSHFEGDYVICWPSQKRFDVEIVALLNHNKTTHAHSPPHRPVPVPLSPPRVPRQLLGSKAIQAQLLLPPTASSLWVCVSKKVLKSPPKNSQIFDVAQITRGGDTVRLVGLIMFFPNAPMCRNVYTNISNRSR